MMRKQVRTIFFIFLIIVLFSFTAFSQKKIELKDLPKKYYQWLTEEVVWIITPKEKEIFLQLGTDRERDIFIEAFWKQRDPVPSTPQNEFKTEHYKRLAYANKFLGRETTRPGCLTDRGQIYIILGPPMDIDRFEGEQAIHPTEVWFYAGSQEDPALPTAFNVVFYKRQGIGEYTLYSPVSDGPYKLLLNYKGDPTDIEAVYEEIKQLEPDLAEYSLTLIPGEIPPSGHLSLISDVLISNIKISPQKKVEDKYAQALLKYKDVIEVEYTANYIKSDFLVKVYQNESGDSFIHYLIEPSSLSVDSYENKYFANFQLIGIFSDAIGKPIFQYEKNFNLEFKEDQLTDIKGKSFVLQDIIPMIPGTFRFNLLIKNTTSKEFSSYEQNILIPPQISNTIIMAPVLLSYGYEKKDNTSSSLKPFQVGDFQYFTPSKASFASSEKMNVFFQIRNLLSDLRQTGLIRYTFIKNSIFHSKRDIPLSTLAQDDNIREEFNLADFPAGLYQLKISLLDSQEKEIISQTTDFELSPISRRPRPWVFSRATPASQANLNFILGNQYLNQGNLARAEELLRTTYEQNPKSLLYAETYCRVLLIQKKFDNIKNILLPFTEIKEVEDSGFIETLGQAFQALKDYENAVKYYKEYLVRKGTNLNILNAIGECYFQLGSDEEALVAWEKSLEINSQQKEIEEKVQSLKKKQKKIPGDR